jgi:hypothetical protein
MARRAEAMHYADAAAVSVRRCPAARQGADILYSSTQIEKKIQSLSQNNNGIECSSINLFGRKTSNTSRME